MRVSFRSSIPQYNLCTFFLCCKIQFQFHDGELLNFPIYDSYCYFLSFIFLFLFLFGQDLLLILLLICYSTAMLCWVLLLFITDVLLFQSDLFENSVRVVEWNLKQHCCLVYLYVFDVGVLFILLYCPYNSRNATSCSRTFIYFFLSFSFFVGRHLLGVSFSFFSFPCVPKA